ncbi:MAG: hypothetical protein C5B51_12695 [Terriglobia bacterium]|nr:MAG: hypothetical protein C5B51_12695 [Terriglobia bacterium]
MVEQAVRLWRFHGIKVHGHESMPTREVCETARAMRVPILVDVAGQAQVVDMLAPQYPQVDFIVAHLGSFGDDWRAHQQVVDQLVRYPNVYSDTSGVRRFDYIVQAVRRAGPRKVLFGSDGPWLHPGGSALSTTIRAGMLIFSVEMFSYSLRSGESLFPPEANPLTMPNPFQPTMI